MKSPNNSQEQKIEKLIKTLGIDLEFTGREIAEILWLSLKRQELMPTKNEPKPKTNIDEQDNKNETIHPNLSFDTPQERTSFQTPETPKPTIPIYPDIRDNTKQKTFAQNNLPLRIPEAPSNPQPLEFPLFVSDKKCKHFKIESEFVLSSEFIIVSSCLFF